MQAYAVVSRAIVARNFCMQHAAIIPTCWNAGSCCTSKIIGALTAQELHAIVVHGTTALLTALAREIMHSPPSVCLHSNSKPSDLHLDLFACVWVMTKGLIELMVKVRGQG